MAWDLANYYMDLAAAWVRGIRPDLDRPEDGATLEAAIAAGLRIHRFKRTATLPRVRRVLGIFKSKGWRERLDAVVRERGLDVERARSETDPSDAMEGLYVKLETEDAVIDRFKFIRSTFLTSVLESGSHWLTRPIVPNQILDGIDLFGLEEAP